MAEAGLSENHMDASKARRMVQAAAWRKHLTETDAESTEAFEGWLAADPLNQAAWRQIQEPWDLFGEHANSPELIELRRAALGNANQAGRRRWLRVVIQGNRLRRLVAVGVTVFVVGAIAVWSLNRPDDYRTAAGERRVVTLTDGSKIALDSRSEVLVSYSEKARDLTLVRGQARFDVAHNVERPFSVLAGGQRVIAIGTVFNVDLLGPKVLVTLIEGRVAVVPEAGSQPTSDWALRSPAPTRSSPSIPPQRLERQAPARGGSEETKSEIILTSGEQLIASARSIPTVSSVNIERATAWQAGQLVFDNEPLSQVVERVNRYSQRTIEIADSETAGLKISGVFNAGDVDAFVKTITHYLPLQAETGNTGTIELKHR